MTSLQNGIIKIIKSAITGEKYPLPEDFSVSDALNIAKTHQVLNLVYYGALNCGIAPSDPAMLGAFNAACSNMTRAQMQSYEFDMISKAFDKNGIDYMPIKGFDIRKLYPKPDMRIMGDIDILIKEDQYDGIKTVMKELGYVDRAESNHEYIWKKNNIYIELHKKLIPSYTKDYYNYFGNGWQLAKPVSEASRRYRMSNEDNFIYMFTHFTKHYRDGGIGLRHLVDIWVLRNSYQDMDYDYIGREFEKLHINDFYKNVVKTIEAIFGDGISDEVTDMITEFIFASGPYGTDFRRLVSSRVKNSSQSRASETARIVFLPLSNMQLEFPVLKKAPVLLPVYWVVRGFRTLFFRTNKIKPEMEKISKVSKNDMQEYEEMMNFVGLKFY